MAIVTCNKCGRPLTDAISIAHKLGPVCRVNKKLEGMGSGNLFAMRAEYNYKIDDNLVYIEDTGGWKSVTNDMENVLADIAKDNKISCKKIMHKDSDGIWDGVRANISVVDNKVSVSGIEFYPITETDFQKAKEKILSK